MKKILYSFFILLAIGLWSCESDVQKAVVLDDVTPNTMSAITPSTMTLLMDNKDNVFQAFTWTAIDFGFQSATTYTVQVDKAGNNFANAKDIVSVTGALTASVSVGDMNTILLSFLDPEVAANVEFRVKASISDYVAPAYSTKVTANITPYATVFSPIYMIGQATGGWNTSLAVEVPSPSYHVYTVIAYFVNSGSDATFRFFAQPDWNPTSYNYPYFTTNSAPTLLENASDGDSNFRFLGTTGWYQITANLNTKTVNMVAVPEPTMYMTGAGVGNGNWDWGSNGVKMTWVKDGKWTCTTTFINGGSFRFFAQADWGPTSYNYPYFPAGSVSALLENAQDGDKNFKVVGATGTYTISVDLKANTVGMVAATK